jgi:hypothetical protein
MQMSVDYDDGYLYDHNIGEFIDDNRDDRYVNMCLRMMYLMSVSFTKGYDYRSAESNGLPIYDPGRTINISEIFVDEAYDVNTARLDEIRVVLCYAALCADSKKNGDHWQLRAKDDRYHLVSEEGYHHSLGYYSRIDEYESVEELINDTKPVCSIADMYTNDRTLSLSMFMRADVIAKRAGEYRDIVRRAMTAGRDPRVPEPIPEDIKRDILLHRMYLVIEKVLKGISPLNPECTKMRYLPPSLPRDKRRYGDDVNFIFQ